jgi:hypothetical protein
MPQRVYLLGCVASVVSDEQHADLHAAGECCITGLFDVVEYERYEPSAYVWQNQWLIERVDGDAELLYIVEDWEFTEQVDPARYASMLVQEREMEEAAMRAEEYVA